MYDDEKTRIRNTIEELRSLAEASSHAIRNGQRMIVEMRAKIELRKNLIRAAVDAHHRNSHWRA